MSEFIRVWQKVDINDISKHLLMVGSATGDCSSCRELGINYSAAKACPKCGTEFRYIASRAKEIKKIKEKRPDLVFIDFEDYKKMMGLAQARGLFGSADK